MIGSIRLFNHQSLSFYMIPQNTFRTDYGSLRSEIDAVNWAIYHNDAFKGIAKKKELPSINRWGNSAFFIKRENFVNRDVIMMTIRILEEMKYDIKPFSSGQFVIIGGIPQKMWGDVFIFPDSDHAWSDIKIDGMYKIVLKCKELKPVTPDQVDDLENFVNGIEKFIKDNQVEGEINDYAKRLRLANSVLKLKKILKEKFGKTKTPKYSEFEPLSKASDIIGIARDEIEKARTCKT
jgi:hypothetical protein